MKPRTRRAMIGFLDGFSRTSAVYLVVSGVAMMLFSVYSEGRITVPEMAVFSFVAAVLSSLLRLNA